MKRFSRITGVLALLYGAGGLLMYGGNIVRPSPGPPDFAALALVFVNPVASGILLLRWRGGRPRTSTRVLAGLLAIWPAVMTVFITAMIFMGWREVIGEFFPVWMFLLVYCLPTAVNGMMAVALLHVALRRPLGRRPE